MKKLTLSVAAVMAMSTFASADINDPGGYIGLGYSYMSTSMKVPSLGTAEATGNAITFTTGYQANDYFALEVRYSTTFGDLDGEDFDGSTGDIEGDMSNIAIYAKPMYKINELSLYGLIGYGMVTLGDDYFSDTDSESGFQWGLGTSYSIKSNIDISIDYTKLYDDAGGFGNSEEGNNIDIDSLTFGVNYKF